MYNKSRSISLIIDGSILLNRYIHLPVLLNSESKDVSIIYYFMKKVMSFIYEYMPDRVHLVFDIGRDIKKKTISNKYKSNRLNVGNKPYDHLLDNKKYQRLSFSRKVLIDIFNITPINVYTLPFVEGDTICAYLCKKEVEKYNKVYLITNDKDFFQLLYLENLFIIMMPTGKKDNDGNKIYEEIYSNKTKDKVWISLGFKNKKCLKMFRKVNFSNISIIRTILGDLSDGIVGVKGYKYKFICDELLPYFIDKIYDDINDFIELLKISESKKIKKFLTEDNIKLMKINYKLMDFNFAINDLSADKLLGLKKEYEREKKFDADKFNNKVYEYELNSVSDYVKWSSILYALERKDWELVNKKSWDGLYRKIQEFMLK